MTKTELRHEAQDEILHYAASIYYAMADNPNTTLEYRIEVEKQLNRVRKIFGHELKKLPTGNDLLRSEG